MAGTGSGRIGRVTRYLLVLNLLVLAGGLAWPYLAELRYSALDEFNAGKIRLWRQPEAYKPGAKTAQPARPAVAAGLCLEIAELSQERYQEVRAAQNTAGLGSSECTYQFDKGLAWWVFWPPEYEEARRDKVIKAILSAGVNDVLPITQGAMAQSFSLGVFNSETQANQFRDRLRGKGLDKVEFGPRPSMANARLGCMTADAGRLEAFKASLPAWAKEAEGRRCWPAGR